MPQDTPIYGITTPCLGEVITVAALQTYASDVESALSTVWAKGTAALSPPAVLVANNFGQTVATGATTTLSYDTESYDRGNMFNPATPTIVTIPEAGTYYATLKILLFSLPTTPTSIRLALLVAGAEVAFEETQGNGTTIQPSNAFSVSALLPTLAAATQITGTTLLTGAVSNGLVGCTLSVTKVAIP